MALDLIARRRLRVRRKAGSRILELQADLDRLGRPRPTVGIRLSVRRSAAALASGTHVAALWGLFSIYFVISSEAAFDPPADPDRIPRGFCVMLVLVVVVVVTCEQRLVFLQSSMVLTLARAARAWPRCDRLAQSPGLSSSQSWRVGFRMWRELS